MVLLVLAANSLVGIWPLAPVEGDEQGVMNGLAEMARGAAGDLRERYFYEPQAGSYTLALVAMKFFGVTPLVAFGSESAICGAIFLILSALMLCRLLAVPWTITAIALLLCQEMTAACYYVNTSTFGAAFGMAGILTMLRSRGPLGWSTAGLLFALSGWSRFDALMLAPVAPVWLWHEDRQRAVRATLFVAAAGLVTLTLLWRVTAVQPGEIISAYFERERVVPWREAVRIILRLTSLAGCTLAVVGFALSVAGRQWRLCTVALAALAPPLLVHGRSLTTPKYFYVAVPFIAALALHAVITLWRRGEVKPSARTPRLLALAALIAIGLESTLALHTWTPQRRRYDTVLSWEREIHAPFGTVPLGFGPGEMLITDDGFRLRTGYLFAPWRWSWEKRRMRVELDRLDQLITANRSLGIVTLYWVAERCTVGLLRAHGLRPDHAQIHSADQISRVTRWIGPGRSCTLATIVLTPAKTGIFQDYAAQIAERPLFFVCDLGDADSRTDLAASGRAWRALSPAPNGIMAIYQLER